MYQIDLKTVHIDFLNQTTQAFLNILYMIWLKPEFYSWALNVMLVFHVYGDNIIIT